MAPPPLPLSKRKDGCRAEAILEYSSKGLAEGQGRVTMRGEGSPGMNDNDEEVVSRMDGHVLREKREPTIP
jgi:hypothetical protein